MGVALDTLEREAWDLDDRLRASVQAGAWAHSPVESPERGLREALVRMPGVLPRFRRTYLAAGRQNFPDSPLRKQDYLQWDRLPTAAERWRAPIVIFRQLERLRRVRHFTAGDIADTGIGAPLLSRTLWPWPPAGPGRVETTETQIRSLYYRSRIEQTAGSRLDAVLEIGGGYGHLAVELLTHGGIGRYVFVELPETLPLAWFYFRATIGAAVGAALTPGEIRTTTRVLLLPPWLLPSLELPIDLAINTASFQHMDRANLAFYFGEIARLKAKRLYLVNRNRVLYPSDVVIDDYPVPAGIRLVDDRPWPLGPALRERVYAASDA